MARRPHADLIEQWLADDSIVIECKSIGDSAWSIVWNPQWIKSCEYRIKPARVYPVTSMTHKELLKIWEAPGKAFEFATIEIANMAIRRYIDDCEAKK